MFGVFCGIGWWLGGTIGAVLGALSYIVVSLLLYIAIYSTR